MVPFLAHNSTMHNKELLARKKLNIWIFFYKKKKKSLNVNAFH